MDEVINLNTDCNCFTRLIEKKSLDKYWARQSMNACISMQNQMIEFTVKLLTQRTNKEISWKCDLRTFHFSPEFSQLSQIQRQAPCQILTQHAQ